MRVSWIMAGLMTGLGLAACAGNSDLITERKGNEITVRLDEKDPAASHRAAREACALDRKRAALAGVSANSLKFVCQPF
jgi:hypothetical protein